MEVLSVDNKIMTVNGKLAKAPSTTGTGDMKKSVYDPTGSVATAGGIPDYVEASAPVTSVNSKTGAVTLGKSDVGLGSVDNVKQYSASNPPPYPVTSVNGQTGAVTVSVPTVPSTTNILKGNGSGGVVAATRGSDYIASGNITKQTLAASESTPADKRPALFDVVARAVDEAFPALHFIGRSGDQCLVRHGASSLILPVDGVALGRRGLRGDQRLLGDVAGLHIVRARHGHRPRRRLPAGVHRLDLDQVPDGSAGGEKDVLLRRDLRGRGVIGPGFGRGDASRAVTLEDASGCDLVLLLDDVGELQRHFVQRRAGRDCDAVLLQVIA